MTLVFVFGTLKRGFPLHQRALRSAHYLGRYKTAERYPMLIAGEWFAPMLLDVHGIGHHVQGELYDVDEETLRRLDDLESIGKPGNFRKSAGVVAAGGGDPLSAEIYMKASNLAHPVHSGLLESYHDQRFIPPEHRL